MVLTPRQIEQSARAGDLKALVEAAGRATSGPWQNGIDDLEGVVAPNNPGLGNVICLPPRKNMYSSLEAWAANAAYIALASPDTITLLATRLEAADAENARLRAGLTAYDAAVAACPLNDRYRTVSAISVCPKCGATPRGNCGIEVTASGVFIEAARAALVGRPA